MKKGMKVLFAAAVVLLCASCDKKNQSQAVAEESGRTLSEAQKACVLVYGSQSGDFVKAPTIGLLMEGGMLKTGTCRGVPIETKIDSSEITKSRAKYVLKVYANNKDSMTVTVIFNFQYDDGYAYISYLKLFSAVSDSLEERKSDGSTYGNQDTTGYFCGLTELLFNMDDVNAALKK